jgi:hypothetical protein
MPQAATEAAASMDFADASSQLAEAAVGPHAVARSECLSRFLGIIKCIAKVPQPAPVNTDALDLLREMTAIQQALQEWVTANRQNFMDIGRGWFADCSMTERALARASTLIKDTQEAWRTTCGNLARDAQEKMPPRTLMEDPTLLADTEKQKTFIATMSCSGVKEAAHPMSHVTCHMSLRMYQGYMPTVRSYV